MKHYAIAIAALLLSGASAIASPCTSGNMLGLYTGEAATPDGVKTDVTLNVFCNHGQADAQLFTSMGDFAVTSVVMKDNAIAFDFDSGASLGKIAAVRKAGRLSGTFVLADDHGHITLKRTGEALAADAMTPRLDLTPAQWHEDLVFFARELARRHANAFFRISRGDYDAEVKALDSRIVSANGDEVLVGFQAIAKSIGDGHTGLALSGMDRKVMPLTVAKFGDEFRVVNVDSRYKTALGTRIVKIGGVPIADVWQRTLMLTPQGELEQLRREDALVYLSRGYALHGLGITPDRNQAVYTVEDDSRHSFEVTVEALAPGAQPDMLSVEAGDALRNQQKDAPFWCRPLPENKAVYCSWRAYQDLDRQAKAMFALLDQTRAEKLILDMRDNGGGDNTVGDAKIVKPLIARDYINRKGHLYVLIGAETFSAAMNNAAQLQDETHAVLVGETIGEKPNSYQEPRQFRLPNSHIIVRASTLYYTFRKSGPNEVAPDRTIIPTWDDVKAARDPVLDWVLAQGAD